LRSGNGGLLYFFEDYVLDTDRRELRRGANAVAVAPQVFDLLAYLIRNRERVVSKDDMIAAIWDGRIVSDAALTTRINVARAAIGDSGEAQHLIRTLPRKGFRFVGEVREEHAAAAITETPAELPRPTLPLPDKPSIAVLPFINLTGNVEQEYFADGVVEDIITELSRFSELFVIARNSSFQYKGKATDVRQVGRDLGVRYVLEGSVRRGGDRLRISAQLIDAATGVHRWAEHYDRKIEDVFAVQDEVVRTIVAILAAHVRKAEIERTRAKPPNSWQAYDYCLQAADALASYNAFLNAEDLSKARRLVQRSLAVDANYARSYAILSHTHVAAYVRPVDSDYLDSAALDRAYQLARTAEQLDANLPQVQACLGTVLTWKHEHDASIAAFERATALNPNYVDWRFGFALIFAGDSRRAIDVLESHMRLDPFYPPVAAAISGLAHYMLKQYPQAVQLLRQHVSRAPQVIVFHAWLAANYARLGRLEEARAEAAEVLRIDPDLTITRTVRRLVAFKQAKDDKHFFDGLRKAGLPA
jgi:adenylate cyclase